MKNNAHVPGGNELLNPQDLVKNKLGITYGSTVADLGCGGSGIFVLQTAQAVGPTGIVYAIDILKSALSNVETRAQLLGFKNIKTIWSNLEKPSATKINNTSVDFALVINILFQNKHAGNILKEAARITKKDGKILVVDWAEGRFPIGPKPEDKISSEEVFNITEALNLSKEKQFEAGKFHYGMVFVKE